MNIQDVGLIAPGLVVPRYRILYLCARIHTDDGEPRLFFSSEEGGFDNCHVSEATRGGERAYG